MFNPFLILYGIVIFGFLISVLAIAYHLLQYQFNRQVTLLTLSLFLGGCAILLLVSFAIAAGIDWKQYSIIFS